VRESDQSRIMFSFYHNVMIYHICYLDSYIFMSGVIRVLFHNHMFYLVLLRLFLADVEQSSISNMSANLNDILIQK